jgi:hypothetical protein
VLIEMAGSRPVMTASDLTCQNAEKTLASQGPSTHDVSN